MFYRSRDLWDMSLGGISKDKEIPHLVGNILYGFLFVLFKVLFRYEVKGIENLRAFEKKEGVVVICNHTSFLDTVFLYISARPKQWIRLLGRESLFDNAKGLVGQILSRVGSFPVKRDSADLTAIKRASKMLKNAEVVGVFPEGTRRGKGTQVIELHAGAALIARMGKAPILPATVRNAEKIKEKGKFFRFPKVSVEYGTPVGIGEFDFLPKEERLDAYSWYMMRECFALSQRCDAEEVNMAFLFPESRDYSEVFQQHVINGYSYIEQSKTLKAHSETVESKDRV